MVIEGRIDDKTKVKESFDKMCQKRIEEGISAIAIGVIYPSELRHRSWETLEDGIRKAELPIKVFTEAGLGGN